MMGGRGGLVLLLALAGAASLAIAGPASAGDLADRVWVVRVATERSTFGAAARQTLLAPALPVEDGLLLAVGFALEPPDDKDEAIQVTAIDPQGRAVPAELVGGDDDLRCTLFRLPGAKPEPVALKGAGREVGDEVVLLSRHGEVMRFAPRRRTARVEARVSLPRPLYALGAEAESWQGAVATTPEGALVGFVDTRPTVSEGVGIMVGIGAQTPVLVPADTFADVPRNLPRKDRPRGWLGVNLAPLDEDHEAYFGLAEPQEGAFVTGVAEGSPADLAGIRLHDVVQSIGDLPLRFEKQEDWNPLLRAVQRLPLGTPLACRLLRFRPLPDGGYEAAPLEVRLTLEARPLDFADAPETEIEDLGFRVKPLTQDWRRANRVPGELQGVVVSRMERASAAQIGGLEVGDLILKLDDKPVPDAEALRKALSDAGTAKRTRIVFFVRRGQATLFVTVQPGG
jgi:serine protease Do